MFESGKVLQERYQLMRQLGRTAAGRQTWLAEDMRSHEQVAVKLLAFSPQMQWEELKLFEREAQVLQALEHPRIPRYRDYFSIERDEGAGLPWFGLVQDYIPGATLQEVIEAGKRFTETQARAIATQVLKILIYLHELSPPVLHRDIKPSNLISGEDNKIYLVDFGAVQAQAAVTGVTFTVVGTSGYAPLEQFWGRAVAASDLYALGATLIHLLTGRAPADLPQKNSRIQFANLVSLNPHFVSWIEKMTEVAIEKRFKTARTALESLELGLVIRHQENHSIVTKISKPSESVIFLEKSPDSLEIVLPYFLVNQYTILFCIGIFFGMIIFYILVFPAYPSFIEDCYNLIFSAGLLLAFFVVLFSPRTQIILKRNSLERRYVIGALIFYKSYKIKNYGEILSPTFLNQVMIRADNRTYNLGGTFTKEECAWLAQEIQDWLNYK